MTVRYLGAVQFEAESRGHKVFCDQPVASGGFDEGMTPVEYLLAALGTCAGYYAAEYLNANKLGSAGLEITVDADKVKNPGRLDNFRIAVHVPAKLAKVYHPVAPRGWPCLPRWWPTDLPGGTLANQSALVLPGTIRGRQ